MLREFQGHVQWAWGEEDFKGKNQEEELLKSGHPLPAPRPSPFILWHSTWRLWHQGLQSVTGLTLCCLVDPPRQFVEESPFASPSLLLLVNVPGQGQLFYSCELIISGKFNFEERSLFVRVNLFLQSLKIWTFCKYVFLEKKEKKKTRSMQGNC